MRKGVSRIRNIQVLGAAGANQESAALSPKPKLVAKHSAQNLPKVAVLLCTYYGQHYLTEQLESFAAQTYPNWEAWVSDDGSLDDTQRILVSYGGKWGKQRFSIHCGPKDGFAANFLFLVCKPDIKADYYAYSDQDDIWEPDKLQRAVDWLTTIPKEIPALYCSRSQFVDQGNNHLGYSPLLSKKPCFANALVQNISGGNTMVFNDTARQLLCQAGARVDVPCHDWWTYLIVSGCGGRVFYDVHPTVRYRQHGGNRIGASWGLSARIARIPKWWHGYFKECTDCNIQALQRVYNRLTPENREILDRFVEARNQWILPRLIGLKRSGIYRQSLFGNLVIIVASALNKL